MFFFLKIVFFPGRDATRAFVTGDFTENGLTDDTEGLSEEDMLGKNFKKIKTYIFKFRNSRLGFVL